MWGQKKEDSLLFEIVCTLCNIILSAWSINIKTKVVKSTMPRMNFIRIGLMKE
jgi:hypothetical protein